MVKKWDIRIPELSGDLPRKAYLYLPASYARDSGRRYPVLYMFDGHNVFYDRDATYGKSWGMGAYMERSKKELIIVAVECNHAPGRRIAEYAPFPFDNSELGHVKGEGNVYMRWMIQTLKPWVDSHYRTLPDRKNTILAGSSMGGLMALYGVCAFNQVFGRAACLSPSLWVSPARVLDMIAKARLRGDTVLYMDYGEKEMRNHTASREAISAAAYMLMTREINLTFRMVPGGTHCEASWEKQVPIFMECLGL